MTTAADTFRPRIAAAIAAKQEAVHMTRHAAARFVMDEMEAQAKAAGRSPATVAALLALVADVRDETNR